MKKALILSLFTLAISTANAEELKTSLTLNTNKSTPHKQVYTVGIEPFAIDIIHKENIAANFDLAIEQELSKQEKEGYATNVVQKSFNKDDFQGVEFTRMTEYGNSYYFIYQGTNSKQVNSIFLQTNNRVKPESDKALKEYQAMIKSL